MIHAVKYDVVIISFILKSEALYNTSGTKTSELWLWALFTLYFSSHTYVRVVFKLVQGQGYQCPEGSFDPSTSVLQNCRIKNERQSEKQE